MKAKRFVLVKHFEGFPQSSDLKLEEEELPQLKENEILLEALYLSVDPYMRSFSSTLPLGITMIGEQVAKVVESKNPKFPAGTIVLASCGWRDKSVVDPSTAKVFKAWDTGSNPLSYALGAVGMPGLTAILGLESICNPQPGETLFVNSSAGIVGSIVGQIGKIKGCRVIGCAGTNEKCQFIKEQYGFDYVFNYKTSDLSKALKEAAPDGIDCYFDNVGGSMSVEVILNHMRSRGRIAVCGSVSAYNAKEPPTGKLIFFTMIMKGLKMQGFLVSEYEAEWPEASARLLAYIKEGRMKVKEEVFHGFEKLPEAFFKLLDGSCSGKVIVKV